MKSKVYTSLILTAVVAVLGMASLSSCEKDKETKVVVTVVDSIGFRAANATVRLFARPTDTNRNDLIVRFDETKITDGEGKVTFDYTDYIKPGQSGFAVLDIEANRNGKEGIAVVKVEEDKIVNKTITVQ